MALGGASGRKFARGRFPARWQIASVFSLKEFGVAPVLKQQHQRDDQKRKQKH